MAGRVRNGQLSVGLDSTDLLLPLIAKDLMHDLSEELKDGLFGNLIRCPHLEGGLCSGISINGVPFEIRVSLTRRVDDEFPACGD